MLPRLAPQLEGATIFPAKRGARIRFDGPHLGPKYGPEVGVFLQSARTPEERR